VPAFSTLAPALSPDGTIVYCLRTSGMNAFNATSGRLLFVSSFNYGSADGSPLVGPNGIVYAATESGSMYAVNSTTGSIVRGVPAWG
jgi:outer membrane protein assembly factor BamB